MARQTMERTDVRDGMLIDWDLPITMDDGVVLRADVFRPLDGGAYPVVMTYGPYAKGLAFQEAYAPQWDEMVRTFPEVGRGSTNKYQNWEVVDPEKWVPDGFVCVRVDSRGAGRSPGVIDIWSPREAKDFYDCIEWAGVQEWSTGKVGLNGISYYAMNQYQVAALQPPHLAAICAWEGASDFYRDLARHGGILSEFAKKWYPRQVDTVQHGVGDRGAISRITGETVAGPETLSAEELAANRRDFPGELDRRPFLDEWYQARNADWSRVQVPMLSTANWGGQGLHLRGNIEAFTNAASEQKWLEVHGIAHWTHFYTDYGIDLQKRFLSRFLADDPEAWADQPPVQLQVRHPGERYVLRHETAWPIPRTAWTRYYLDASSMTLGTAAPGTGASVSYEALGDGLTFSIEPFAEETEVTGPMAAKLFISSSTADADLFLVVRVFDPDGDEVTFQGALDPNTPISLGWLRASHRKLDEARSLPYRPFHPHDEAEPLEPGTVYEVDVEIWPSCIVIPAGYRLALSVRGNDYRYEGELSEFAKTFHYANHGVGPFTHDDPADRPREVFGNTVTLYTGGEHPSFFLVPIIPPADA